jgi:hypothetical protein
MWARRRYSTEDIVAIAHYPDVDNPDIQIRLSQMLEFTYLEQHSQKLFPYQEFVRRYMSPYTPYKFLILFHSLGSGKTIATISIAVDNFLVLGRECIIVTKGLSSEINFREQIHLYKEISGKEFPESLFSYVHYIELANKIRSNDDNFLVDFFSNKVFIMDEIHNLKNIKDDGTLQTICRGIKNSSNSKFIYLTATPMVDSWTEIESLLLLVNRPLPRGYDDDTIRSHLNGIVSYSNKSVGKAKEKNMGNVLINGTKYYASHIKGNQLKYYMEEHGKKTENVFYDLIQISLFCLPGGIYGNNIIDTYLKSNTESYPDKKLVFRHYTFNTENTILDLSLEGLEEASAVYTSILKILQNTPTGKIFIFMEHIKGSGIIILSALLEYYGYNLAGEGSCISKGKFFTICIGDKIICPNLNERLQAYNSPENMEGEYIQILIGSKIIGESVNLLNVKQFHFISHHWNTSYLEQSKGRVIREGSHLNPNTEVEIYIHISLLSNGKESIDEYKIKTSESKQDDIKRITNIMIECAVDKYIFSPFSSKSYDNYMSFVILYSHEYVYLFIDHIFDLVILYQSKLSLEDCKTSKYYYNIDILIDKLDKLKILLSPSTMPELIGEIVKNIITHNLCSEKYPKTYLRCSYRGLYTIENIHWPFWDFAPLDHVQMSDSVKLLTNTQTPVIFDNLPTLESRILYLEKLWSNNQMVDQCYDSLFIVHEGCTYHLMQYNTNQKAYNASVIVPRDLKRLTRKFDQNQWTYIENKEEEKLVFKSFECKRLELIEQHKLLPFYGYISIIDKKIKYRAPQKEDIVDRRKITRGISLDSLIKKDILDILKQCDLIESITDSDSKQVMISKLTEYMYANNYYCYI